MSLASVFVSCIRYSRWWRRERDDRTQNRQFLVEVLCGASNQRHRLTWHVSPEADKPSPRQEPFPGSLIR
jgi:hypothetical protein